MQNPSRPQTGDLLLANTSVFTPRKHQNPPSGTGVAAEPGTVPPPPEPPPSTSRDPTSGAGTSRVQETDAAAKDQPRPVLNYDETSFYQTCRYVTSMEATWRILSLPLFYFSHKVNPLAVHLEGENPTVFKKGEAAAAALKELRASTLTAYFDLVEESRTKPEDDPDRLLLQRKLYGQIPKYYVWEPKLRKWERRKKSNKPNLGRLSGASPNAGERFYLRILLQEVPGCASFEELRTHDGTIFPTFKAACVSRGLAKDDAEFKR